jgi:hypothetical protein
MSKSKVDKTYQISISYESFCESIQQRVSSSDRDKQLLINGNWLSDIQKECNNFEKSNFDLKKGKCRITPKCVKGNYYASSASCKVNINLFLIF